MANPAYREERQPLTAQSFDTPELGQSSPFTQSPPPVIVSHSPTPTPSSRHRIAYARTPSISFSSDESFKAKMSSIEEDDSQAKEPDGGHGLGIEVGSHSPGRSPPLATPTIKRIPVGAKSGYEPQTPDPGRQYNTPSTGALSGSTRFGECFDEVDISYGAAKQYGKQSSYSLTSIDAPSLSQASDGGLLRKSASTTLREQYDDFRPTHVCSSAKHFKGGMNNWLAITIIILSLFSTIFSMIFLFIGLRGPKYDMIGKDGSLTISSAAFLTSFFAKMIELSFITVVVAFIGQALSRKAFGKRRETGVTLAEISMRSWIVQPGTMFTHWQSVRYAAPTWLGFLALVSAIVALLYTSAATALVQPQLKFGDWERRPLQGPVMASFANGPYLQATCKTPITYQVDQGDAETTEQTCISNEHASQAYHNYFHWIGRWTDVALGGNGTRDLSTRPTGWALLNDNTTITAPWIERMAPTSVNGWFVNNVTMAMPHPGVALAAVDPANHIPQPEELNGLGIYSIRASVPSPFINVLCVMGMSASQLDPLIWETWDKDNKFKPRLWPEGQLAYDDPYLGGTQFDDIFQWGEKYGPYNWPPVFPKLPRDYNTLINDTTGVTGWGRTSIYFLGKGGDVDATANPTDDNYALCQLQVGQTPDCSTRYNASSSVGTLEALCEDSLDDMRYIKSMSNATSGQAALSADWPNVATLWATALNLNTGYFDDNGTNSRLLTEFILTNASVDWSTGGGVALTPTLPSPAEALAEMSACTLLQSAQDAPFVEFWNYSASYLDEPQIQWFNATIRAQQYASGGIYGYQKAFHLVLFAVFAINVFILGAWIRYRDWYTDFSDPTNLFSLAINSPPSKKLADCSCGAPRETGERFKHYWKLENHDGHVVMESPEINEMDDLEHSPGTRRRKVVDRLSNALNRSNKSPVGPAL